MGPESGDTSLSNSTIPIQSNAEGADSAALIAQITGSGMSAEQMRSLATKASIPVPGGSGQEMPASLMYQPKQFTASPSDRTPVVGRRNARNQGIGNSITGVLNIIGAVKTGEDNKKKLQIATDTHTLLTEQHNIDQATQAIQALPQDDPQRKTLQAAIDASKQRQQGILADKKTRDAIAKGFHIDFTDPQANNTPDHQAVQQGQKMAEASLSYSDQFNQKAPAPLGPNTTAQAQYESAVKQQELQQKSMAAFIPLVRSMMTNQAQMDKQKLHEGMENARNMVTNQTRFTDTMAQIQGRRDLAKTQFGYKMAEIGAEGNKQLSVFSQELTMKAGDPLTQIKAYEAFKTNTAKTQAGLASTVASLEAQKTTMIKAKADPSQIQSMDSQINAAKAAEKAFSDATDAAQKYYNQLAGVKEGGEDSGGSTDSDTSGLSSSSTYLNAPGDEDKDDDNDSSSN